MIVDYWILRKTRLDVAELYRYGAGGRYWFSNGFNWRALAGGRDRRDPGDARAS